MTQRRSGRGEGAITKRKGGRWMGRVDEWLEYWLTKVVKTRVRQASFDSY